MEKTASAQHGSSPQPMPLPADEIFITPVLLSPLWEGFF
jgi:hypothetical protein